MHVYLHRDTTTPALYPEVLAIFPNVWYKLGLRSLEIKGQGFEHTFQHTGDSAGGGSEQLS